MTENKAIEIIKYASAFNSDNSPLTKALEVAIQALEEIQQYRAIGTVEDIYNMLEVLNRTISELHSEVDKYRAIGTIEEFKALKENQFFNFDSPVVRIDKKSYDKAIDDLCNEFHKDWEEQSENDMEDCINWYDWLIACAEQLKGEKQ